MKQRQSMGGVGLLILMLLVIMFFSLKVPGMATERELSYPEFMVYLENKTVESAQIRPNREVPTGEVVFETTSGDREEFNVLDVKEVEMALRKAGVPYTTTSVRQDSYFMTVILPIALSAGVLIFLFMFINSRSGGGGKCQDDEFWTQPCPDGIDQQGQLYQSCRSGRGERGTGGDRRFPEKPAEIHRCRSAHPEGRDPSRTSGNW